MAHPGRAEQSIVGRGARIDGDGSVTRCVLWPGAHVTTPLVDAVVTSRGTVVPALSAG